MRCALFVTHVQSKRHPHGWFWAALSVVLSIPSSSPAQLLPPSQVGPELPHLATARWKLAWSDEFNGPQPGEDASCYTREPQCVYDLNGEPDQPVPGLAQTPSDCPTNPEVDVGDLNRCNWGVLHAFNYWSRESNNQFSNLNAFDAGMVKVEDGALILRSAENYRSLPAFDCGSEIEPNLHWTSDCEYLSGGVWSKRYDDPGGGAPLVPGFAKLYGRIEVRAKVAVAPGGVSAFWMLPDDWHLFWPGDGEIDILEHFVNWNGAAFQTVHAAGTGPHLATSYTYHSTNPVYDNTLSEEFHVYGVRWSPTNLIFTVDNRIVAITRRDQTVEQGGVCHPMPLPPTDPNVPLPFHFILTSGVLPYDFAPAWAPTPTNFVPFEDRIDYVRVYDVCSTEEEYCPWGGSYDGANCAILPIDPGASAFIFESSLFYAGEPEPDPCPFGGTLDGAGNCLIYFVPPEASSFIFQGYFYTVPGCVEDTLSPFCKSPCGGVGWFDGFNCYLGSPPGGMTAIVAGGDLRYKANVGPTSSIQCRPGDAFVSPTDGCLWMDVPSGRSAFVYDNLFYVTATCSATANTPNCADPCPVDGTYDGANCYIFTSPGGTAPFVYQNGFYYTAVAGPDPCPYEGPYGVWYDGLNCYLNYTAPSGSGPFLNGNDFYLTAACGNTTDWAAVDPANFDVQAGDRDGDDSLYDLSDCTGKTSYPVATVAGTGQGGFVVAETEGIQIDVVTNPGESAESIATRVASAIGTNPLLKLLNLRTEAELATILSEVGIEFDSLDPGIKLLTGLPVPVLSAGGIVVLTAALVCSFRVVGRRASHRRRDGQGTD